MQVVKADFIAVDDDQEISVATYRKVGRNKPTPSMYHRAVNILDCKSQKECGAYPQKSTLVGTGGDEMLVVRQPRARRNGARMPVKHLEASSGLRG